MSFLDKIFGFMSSSTRPPERGYWIAVRCKRCGEVIRARVDLYNDLSANYEDSEAGYAFYTRKYLVGEKNCYQTVEVELRFNEKRQLVDRAVEGGTFVAE